MKTLIVDSGASASVSGYADDFVPSTLKPLLSSMSFDGIGGAKHATHKGVA